MKQRSGSSSLFALKLKSFASLLKWCAAHYTRHMKCHVSLRDLYGLCVNARTDSGKSQAVWMNQNQTIPGWFPEHITRVFSGISVWKRLMFPSMNRSSPVPAVDMQPQTMMLPPPCLTVGKAQFSWYSSPGRRHTCWTPSESNKFTLDSSDHRTWLQYNITREHNKCLNW